jgi:hypothetical protein
MVWPRDFSEHLCDHLATRSVRPIRPKGERGDADKNLDWFYVVSPRIFRYSMGLREPRDILIRFSLYQRI